MFLQREYIECLDTAMATVVLAPSLVFSTDLLEVLDDSIESSPWSLLL